MEFKEWLNRKFLEWEKDQGRRMSYSAFSRYLGMKQTTFSQWINGNVVPGLENANIIAEKLGNEVYEVLGYAVPGDPDPWEGFPPTVRSALESARDKIIDLGVTGDSPEALAVVIEAMRAAGFKQISKAEHESITK